MMLFAALLQVADPAATPVVFDTEALTNIINSFQQGKVAVGIALMVGFVVGVLRGPILKRLPQWQPVVWLQTQWGGWVLNLTASLATGVAAFAAAGGVPTAASVITLVLGAVTSAFTTAGMVNLKQDVAQAVKAGQAGAADPGKTINS